MRPLLLTACFAFCLLESLAAHQQRDDFVGVDGQGAEIGSGAKGKEGRGVVRILKAENHDLSAGLLAPNGRVLRQNPMPQHREDLSMQEVCGSPQNLTGSAIATVCGAQAKLCFTFMRNGVDTLKIGPDFTSGCPSIKLEGCRTLAGNLPDQILPMDCFSAGSQCELHSGCDKCIEAGCGWCTAGYSSEHACMPGTKYGPVCDTCGTGCDWNFGVCPMDQDELQKREVQLNMTEKKLAQKTRDLDDLEKEVSSGEAVRVGNKDYECGKVGAASAASTLTWVMSIVMLIIGCVGGGYLGKRGLMFELPTMPFFSRMRDKPILSSSTGGRDSYVPPDL